MTIKNNILIKVENNDIPKSGEFIIPDDVKIIGEEVFKNFQELKSIIISGSVKKIESKAFKNCKNLKRVSFSNGLEEIENEAFSHTSLHPGHHNESGGYKYHTAHGQIFFLLKIPSLKVSLTGIASKNL